MYVSPSTAPSSARTGSQVTSSSMRDKFRHDLLFYSFSSIVFISVAFASHATLADCVELSRSQNWELTTTLGATALQQQRLRRSRNANYSLPAPLPQLPLPHDHLAAFGYRTKQKPQQFFQRDLTSLNLVNDEQREDICKEHCTCARKKSAFIAISCDFQTNRKLSSVFGSNFRIPSEATSIVIKLAASTSFRLERGFFNNNRINSVTIEGVYSESEQVEIATEAFQGNLGPYPDILMSNVFSVIVRTKAFSANGKFTVRNANDLILYSDAFENAEITGLFLNIIDLRIMEKAFNSAHTRLRIESSHIDNIYRFEASLQEIRFINCTIGTINGGTFDVIEIKSIVFEDCHIDTIKARAITEKLHSKYVSITGATIGSIESEAIYGSGIDELILAKNKIDTIQANAIHVTAMNTTIAENNIKHLEKNWLRVKDWSNIVIEKNQFGEFGNMVLEETKRPVTCRFDSNSLTKTFPGSLNITNRNCILREISINMPCRCNLQWLEALSSHDLRSETYCTIDDKLENCFNSSTFNTLKYLNEVCDESKTTVDCVANKHLKRVDGKFFTPEDLAADNHLLKKLMYVVGACIALVVLVLIVILFIYRCLCRDNNHCEHSANRARGSDHLHKFSDQDLHIIEQARQMMEKRYPGIDKQLNARIKVLLQQNISNEKCVKTISQIVNILNEASIADFEAFNQMLTRHLEPPLMPLPSAPTPAPTDPIYSEPTIVAIPPEEQAPYSGPTTLPEHIYAEPSCTRQPLLHNEYASPADRNLDSLDVYTEPINERDGSKSVISPYSVASAVHQRPLQYAMPSRARTEIRSPPLNLPDVLNQSHNSNSHNLTNAAQLAGDKPLTNVQRIAQNLQSQPKFQISLQHNAGSTRPQHLHLVAPPLYSAPSGRQRPQNPLTNDVPMLASPERDEDFELELRGAAAIPIDCSSDHSGGSNETVQIDDIILYADA